MATSATITHSWYALTPFHPLSLQLTPLQLTDWLAHIPKEALARNFQTSISTFDKVPGEQLYIFPGSMFKERQVAAFLILMSICLQPLRLLTSLFKTLRDKSQKHSHLPSPKCLQLSTLVELPRLQILLYSPSQPRSRLLKSPLSPER